MVFFFLCFSNELELVCCRFLFECTLNTVVLLSTTLSGEAQAGISPYKQPV